jgi:tetratricopeptide (TPR) repeat protein
MLSGARRAKTSLRQPGPKRPAEPPREEGKVGLRLALAQGSLGMELAAPVRLGPVDVQEISVRLEDLRFPLDLSGGVARFRHRRGRLMGGTVDFELGALGKHLEPKLRGQLVAPLPVALTIASAPLGVISVGVASEGAALAFDVVLAPMEQDLRVLVEDARALGLAAPAHVAAVRLVGLALRGLAEVAGGGFIVRDPLGQIARRLLPDAGARAPATRGLAISVREKGALDIVLEGRVGAPGELSSRAIRALEAAELAGPGDQAALAGDLEAARTAYLAALERAPRHAEIATRLAALDLSLGDRAEAALATLVDLSGPLGAGLLGSLVLESVGENEAAYASAARAAADEPFGPLAALAWLRAARLAPDAAARTDALDRAIVRSPSLSVARWERFVARLHTGDIRGALGDAQHAEASAPSHERFDVCRRAAEALAERGHLAEAQTWFERALRQRPKSAAAIVGLARALRDLGKPQRALDLFARAIEIDASDPERDRAADLEMARLLATYAGDRPAAIARVAEVPQTSEHAAEARLLEAAWRAELGDGAGASRAAARLRSFAEARAQATPANEARRVADRLVELASLEERLLSDAKAAERDLALAVRLDPSHREAARQLRRVARDTSVQARPEPPPAPPPPSPESPEVFEDSETSDLANDEAMVERLTEKLRADPSDEANVAALGATLERLGRDLEVLALLSGRLEEASPAARPGLESWRNRVLHRLAVAARREGRADEAALYESMIQ